MNLKLKGKNNCGYYYLLYGEKNELKPLKGFEKVKGKHKRPKILIYLNSNTKSNCSKLINSKCTFKNMAVKTVMS